MKLDKAQLAHEMAVSMQSVEPIVDMGILAKLAWDYADAMQAEADKRVDKGVPDALADVGTADSSSEWQSDWSQAPDAIPDDRLSNLTIKQLLDLKETIKKLVDSECDHEWDHVSAYGGKGDYFVCPCGATKGGETMKEYLIKKSDGSYFNQMACDRESREPHAKDWVEIPEGAIEARLNGSGRINFIDSESNYMNVATSGQWIDTHKHRHDVHELVWSRGVLDNVNQPQHYCSHPSGIECIEITQHHDFSVGNAIKYLWRAGLKGSDTEVQDLKKAVWYIENKIKLLESSDD